MSNFKYILLNVICIGSIIYALIGLFAGIFTGLAYIVRSPILDTFSELAIISIILSIILGIISAQSSYDGFCPFAGKTKLN